MLVADVRIVPLSELPLTPGHLLVGAFFVCMFCALMMLAVCVGHWLSTQLERIHAKDAQRADRDGQRRRP